MRFGYDGGRFHGVPPQPDLPTVGGAVRDRFWSAFDQKPRNLAFTSRTDGGVHARGNFSTCWIPEIPLPELNAAMAAFAADQPDGLRDVAAVLSPKPTHARALAAGKHYRYTIETGFSPEALDEIVARVSWRGRTLERKRLAPPPADPVEASTWQIFPAIDLARMQRAAAHLIGEHDFNALRMKRCSANITVKSIDEITITAAPSAPGRVRYTIDVRGKSFLRKMVRIIVGTLVEVGVGLREPDSMPALIATRDRRYAGITAPSRGLILQEIVLLEDWFGQ